MTTPNPNIPTSNGNAGIYRGKIQVHYTDEKGIPSSKLFYAVEAVRGTWLSAVCRRLGWAAIYGPDQGYGAYVEGVVHKADGSIYVDSPVKMDHAITAFTWRQHGRGGRVPLSRAFARTPGHKVDEVTRAWDRSWTDSMKAMDDKFRAAQTKLYMTVAESGGDVSQVSAFRLREFMKKKAKRKHTTPARHCDTIMVGVAEPWKNLIPTNMRHYWDLFRKAGYPN
jgi:hypothetical protein